MFYYRPSKSSVWGHFLRKMPAEREKARFTQFLATAVGKYKFLSGRLTIARYSGFISTVSPSDSFLQRFEQVTGLTSRQGDFGQLTQKQSEKCIDEIVKYETLSREELSSYLVTLTQSFTICAWRIDGQDVGTNSQMNLNYGKLPAVSTFLQFDTIEHFQYIKRVLEDLRFCKLNEKHLNIRKRRENKNDGVG